jgi:transposase-like protein
MMRRFVSVEALFNGRHFHRQIIILCVTWYTCFKLSFRDLVIIMAERRISLAHTTILRWVQHYLPEFEKRRKRYARPVGGSWRMDETYIKVRGQWVYLYQAALVQTRVRYEILCRCTVSLLSIGIRQRVLRSIVLTWSPRHRPACQS